MIKLKNHFQNLFPVKDGWSSLGLHIVLIVFLSCAVYSNTLNNSFHLDDFYRVANNPGIEKVWPITRHFVDPSTMSTLPRITMYRPLLPLTLSINYAISGYSLPGFHIVNIGIHTLSAIIVYLFCIELLGQTRSWQDQPRRSRWLALMVATVFVVHPVSGYPVNYICGRDLLMMELFLMSSFLIYVRMRRAGDSWWRWFFILLLFALSLFSKQNAMVMPALIFVYEWTVRQRPILDRSIWLRTLPFIGLVIGFFAYTHYGLNTSSLGQTLATTNLHKYWIQGITQLKLHLGHYGANFIWPLNVMEGHYIKPVTLTDPGPFLGFLLVALTLYTAWRLRQSAPLISFCILAYWVLLAPSSSVIPLRVVADYRPYPSSVFLYLAVGMIAFTYLKRKVLITGCFVLLVYLGATAVYINTTWKTEESFWARSVANGSGSTMAHLNYAMAAKDMNIREKYLRKGLEMNPNYILVRLNLGLTLIHKGQKEEGLDLVKRAVAQDPRIAQSHYWLAIAYRRTGKAAEAAESAALAVTLHRLPRYQYQAGFLMQQAGRHEDSIPYLKAVQEYNPSHQRTGFLLGFAHQKAGRAAQAIKTYQAYLEKKPRDIQARFNRAYALMHQGQFQDAIEGFNKTLELKPNYVEVHLHLSTCYKNLGNSEEAQRHLALWNSRPR